MAEHHRKRRTGDRHTNKGRMLRPDEALWDEALAAVRDGLSWTMLAWFTECLRYVVGLRKSFPPRPQWAEERAAALPDDDPIRPPGDIDT